MNPRTMAFGVSLLMSITNTSWAEPLKKGRIMCERENCRDFITPTGGMIDEVKGYTVQVNQEQKSAQTKTVITPSVKSSNGVKKKRGRDQVHLTQAAPIKSEIETNLPNYYAGVDRDEIEASEKVIFVPKSHDPRLKGFKSGDVIWAVVEQEITASPELPTPIRAIATSGPFKGAYFVGEATLDKELKRVLFNFSKLRPKGEDEVYTVKAAGLSPLGSIGLNGEYVSQTGKFFIAELASAAAAGFVDSTINRNQTALGTYVQDPSLANSGKGALVTALSKTTDRMAESVRQAPEYTHIQGYQEIKIMIQDDPVESGS